MNEMSNEINSQVGGSSLNLTKMKEDLKPHKECTTEYLRIINL